MKTLKLIFLLFFFNNAFSQNLPFTLSNFSPITTSTLDTPDYEEGSHPRYLLIDNPSNHLATKGFNVNMNSTTRTEFDLDFPVYSENSSSSNFTLSFTGAANLTFLKSQGFDFASMNYSYTPNAAIPVSVKVFDMDYESYTYNLTQGNIGSVKLIRDTIDGEVDTTTNAPYLMGIYVNPESTKTLVKLIFHNKVQFNISTSQIIGKELHFYIEKPYSQISSAGFSLSNIETPISIYNYTSLTMTPSVDGFPVNSGYSGDELTLTGNNLVYIENISFAGKDVLYQIVDNQTVKIILPDTPTSAPLILGGNHGNVSTEYFSVSTKPECNAIPSPSNPFFYFYQPQSIKTVFKWGYSGNPSSTFEVRYRNDPNDEWTTENVSTSNEMVLTDPTPFTTYQFQVRASCPNELYSEWSEEAAIKIEYTDKIEVSQNLNKALLVWMRDSIDPDPMDSFLINFSDPSVELDERECAGFVDRFFERGQSLYTSLSDVPTINSITCICKVVTVDLSQVYENKQNNLYDYGQEHRQGGHQVGFKCTKFRYFGPAQRNYSGCMDYDTRNNGKQYRRHTENNNKINIIHTNGDTAYTSPQSYATIRMAYLCANPDMVPSACACNKDVYITAEIKADVCAKIYRSECKNHSRKDDGGRAETGFGGIITTGIDYGDPIQTAQSIRVLAAGHHNIFVHRNHSQTWNPIFVQKGISLLYNTTIVVAAASGGADFTALLTGGYLTKAVNDLGTLLSTNPYNVTYEEAGSSGCKSYSIVHNPADEYKITIKPNEERFVTVATVSYSHVKGWGCYYDIASHMQCSYHLAAATNRYDFSNNPSCCINPTASYATRSIDINFNPQSGGLDHKDHIETFLYKHGDRIPIPANPNFSSPFWIDINGMQAQVDNQTARVIPWSLYTQPAGRLSGKYEPCKPEMLHDYVIQTPISGGGGTVPVTMNWIPSLSVYRTGYNIERGYSLSNMEVINSSTIPRDTIHYTDTVDTSFDTAYYKVFVVNSNNNTHSDYSNIIAVPIASSLGKKGNTSANYISNNSSKMYLLAYPNPSSSTSYITYNLPTESNVSLTIYDMKGRKMSDIIANEPHKKGIFVVETDMQKLSKGMYIILMKTDRESLYKYIIKE